MLRVHILSEPILSPKKEGLCKVRYEKDGLLGWMCPVFDSPLYENGADGGTDDSATQAYAAAGEVGGVERVRQLG